GGTGSRMRYRDLAQVDTEVAGVGREEQPLQQPFAAADVEHGRAGAQVPAVPDYEPVPGRFPHRMQVVPCAGRVLLIPTRPRDLAMTVGKAGEQRSRKHDDSRTCNGRCRPSKPHSTGRAAVRRPHRAAAMKLWTTAEPS